MKNFSSALKTLGLDIYSRLSIIAFTLVSAWILLLVTPEYSTAIGPNFDYYTKLKLEYQYTDYFEYKWPDYVEYFYGETDFSQPSPFLSKFPEHRFLTKITQAFGPDLELQVKYQYGYLGELYEYSGSVNPLITDDIEEIYNARLEYKINDNLTVNGSGQYTSTAGDFHGWMGDWGFKYDFGGFFMIEPSLSLFWNEVGGSRQNAQSYNLKLRQALTNTTALQVKYNFFNASGESGFHFNTITTWLSQWLPTQTALHFSLRYHWDSLDGESLSPGIEAIQYLNWATQLHLSYRFFSMTSDDPESAFFDQIDGDSFDSNSFAIILKRNMWADTDIMVKYRYYGSNQDTRMGTYLLGIEQVF